MLRDSRGASAWSRCSSSNDFGPKGQEKMKKIKLDYKSTWDQTLEEDSRKEIIHGITKQLLEKYKTRKRIKKT